jgi:nucleoside phosphorylase
LANVPELASQEPVGNGRQKSAIYDLGLIIALREEFDCAREMLDFEDGFFDGGYYLYPFSVPDSDIRGICLVLHDMGPTHTGVAATHLLDRHPVKALALTGIAGALDGAFRLGDVVVASSVDEYFHRALARSDASGEGFDFDSGSVAWRGGRDITAFANNFRYSGGRTGEFADWRARGKDRREAIGLPRDPNLAGDQPDYFVAAIASGSVVGAAKGFADWLRRHNRNCGAIEMEASGVAHAVFQHGGTDMIIVRGFSDFADERKQEYDQMRTAGVEGGAWRRYAALNAIDLLIAMVRSPAFPWNSAKEDPDLRAR